MYAFLLYFRDKQFKELPSGLRKSLPVLRFLFVSILAFLLLEPFLRNTDNTERKPILVFAQDNSASVLNSSDSGWIKVQYPKEVRAFLDDLQDKFEVIPYSFSGDVSQGTDFSFEGKETDISKVFREVEGRLGNLNLGAIILASDGNFNKGLNPLYSVNQLQVPVYGIALGDTSRGKDLSISNVFNNKIAFLGNTFPIEVVVDAEECADCATKVQILKDGTLLHQENFNPGNISARKVINFQVKAESTGHQKYLVRVSRVEGEVSYTNNEQSVFIEVLDNRQKILMLARAPHPDVNAIRSAIEKQEGYETELVLSGEFKGDLNPYSLLIALHLTGTDQSDLEVLQKATVAELPVWFIAGTGTRIQALPGGISGMDVQAGPGRYNDVFPVANNKFSLFTLDESSNRIINDFPPLSVPFGNYTARPNSQILLNQRVGNVNTNYPLWTFSESEGRKTSFVAGEGLWRWRMKNYSSAGNHDAFDLLVQKTIQYLSVKADKRNLRVLHKESFAETEKIILDAELYNESFELVNEPDVRIEIENESGEKFSYLFNRTQNTYRLDAGNFPAGIYSYSASVIYNGVRSSDKGEFVVLPVSAELQSLSADHGLLYELAAMKNGSVVSPGELNELNKLLREREDLKPVLRSEITVRPFVELWWVLLLIILLVTAEWFIRRRYGAY